MFVSNLSSDVTSEALREFFAEYGTVDSANIIMDKETGKSKGFAFVEMPDDSAAQKAMSELNGGLIEGKPVSVTITQEREARGGGGFGGGSNRGGGGGFGGGSNRGGGEEE